MGSISRVISQRFRVQASAPGSSGGESPTSTNPCRSTSTVPSSSSSSLRRKPLPEKPRKELRKQRSADELQIRGGLWPSAKNLPGPANVATLRDHLINESKNEEEDKLEDGRRPIVGVATHAASTFSSRQRSGPDSPANLENNININMIGGKYRSSSLLSKKKKTKKKKNNKKQQQPGGTPPSPSSSSCSSFSGPIPSAARLPVDDNNENALSARIKRRSEFGLHFPSSTTEFDRNDCRNSRSRAPIKIASKVIRKSGSPVRSSKSPELRNSRSPPVLHNSRSPVLRRPRSPPSKVMIGGGMGNIINMGLMGSLFRRKSFSGAAAQVTTESSPAKEAINGLSTRRGVPAEGVGSPARGSQAAVLELQHKLRMDHNHLMQWRFINGRMVAVNTNKWATAQKELVSAWVGLLELQVAVTQKRLQLANHKLSFKLNTLISPQIKEVERWGNMEKHHMAAISSTKDCLHAVVCRLPLSDRAKADPQILSILLRKATNLMTAINGNIGTCNSMAQRTVPLVAQLAQLVSKEKPLIEECFELLEFVSKLQFREESLRCHLIQLKS